MPLYTKNGILLVSNGSLASHEDCCCGGGVGTQCEFCDDCYPLTATVTFAGVDSCNECFVSGGSLFKIRLGEGPNPFLGTHVLPADDTLYPSQPILQSCAFVADNNAVGEGYRMTRHTGPTCLETNIISETVQGYRVFAGFTHDITNQRLYIVVAATVTVGGNTTIVFYSSQLVDTGALPSITCGGGSWVLSNTNTCPGGGNPDGRALVNGTATLTLGSC